MVTCICCSDRLRGRWFFRAVPRAEPGARLYDAPSRVGLEPDECDGPGGEAPFDRHTAKF